MKLIYTTVSRKGTETEVDVSLDLMIDIIGFSTRRIHFWGQKCRNLAGSLPTPGPYRAFGPRIEHFGRFFAFLAHLKG